MLSSDRPIATVDGDQFEFSTAFVPTVERVCLEWPSEDGLVVGLFGAWGSGKSSAMNLLSQAITQRPASCPPTFVARFSPWLYEDPSALILSFFASVASAVSGTRQKSTIAKAQRALLSMGQLLTVASKGLSVAGVSFDFAQFSTAVQDMKKVTSELGETAKGASVLASLIVGSEDKLQRARTELTDALGNLNGRVLVLVDDVDRLASRELLELLRLIRIVADLPRVTILVAMDDQRVRDVLTHAVSDGYGAGYLDKIIQVAVVVPPITYDAMGQALDRSVKRILADLQIDQPMELAYLESQIFPNALNLILELIKTPRDLTRFSNGVRTTLADLRGRDIHLVDAILLEALHTMRPDVYARVRDGRTALLREEQRRSTFHEHDSEVQRTTAAYERIIHGGKPDSERDHPVERILERLFGRRDRNEVVSSEAARERRIRTAIAFDNYFRFAIPIGEVSRSEVEDALAAMALAAADNDVLAGVAAFEKLLVDRSPRTRGLLLEDLAFLIRDWGIVECAFILRVVAGSIARLPAEVATNLISATVRGTLHWRPEYDDVSTGPLRTAILSLLLKAVRVLPLPISERLPYAAAEDEWVTPDQVKRLQRRVLRRGMALLRGDWFDLHAVPESAATINVVRRTLVKMGLAGQCDDEFRSILSDRITKNPDEILGVLYSMSVVPSNGRPVLHSTGQTKVEAARLLVQGVDSISLVQNALDQAGVSFEVDPRYQQLIAEARTLVAEWHEHSDADPAAERNSI